MSESLLWTAFWMGIVSAVSLPLGALVSHYWTPSDQTLKRLHAHKDKLLLVLKRPDIVLHTNGSEGDIRGYVKWRKISGATRSDLAKRCRDGFASLTKTFRKLGVSSSDYLGDRIGRHGAIAPLADIVRERASAALAVP